MVLDYSIWEFQREEATDIKELFNVLEEVKTGQKNPNQTKPNFHRPERGWIDAAQIKGVHFNSRLTTKTNQRGLLIAQYLQVQTGCNTRRLVLAKYNEYFN